MYRDPDIQIEDTLKTYLVSGVENLGDYRKSKSSHWLTAGRM